jgi:hypothetical protein
VTVTAPSRPPRPDELQALIEEAWQHARRRRRRRIRLALLVAGMVGIGGAVDTIGSADGGRSLTGGSRPTGAAVRVGGLPVRYWYTRTVVAAGATVIGIAEPSARETIETWIGTDGTWRQRVIEPSNASASSDAVIGGDGLFPPQANATGTVNGVAINNRNPGDGLFTWSELQSLPTSTTALRGRIGRAVAAQTTRDLNDYVLPGSRHRQIVARLRPRYFGGPAGQTGQALIAISDLEASPLPARLRAALFAVARTLPGVRATNGAHDALGRTGVALSQGGGPPLIFDPRTGKLLAGVSGTVITQGPVNSISAIPKHLTPIAEPRGLQPPEMAIEPRSGAPSTTFTIRLATPTAAAHFDVTPILAANMFGPTGPGCLYWFSRPSFVRIPPGIAATRAGNVTYTYQLSAGAIARLAWCPGRYQLLISPIWPLPAPRSPGPTDQQLSHAAAYFTVR